MNLFTPKSASVYNSYYLNGSREKFYSRYIFERNINSIISLFKAINTKAVEVKNNILFDDLAFGSTTKSVTSILGKPKCTFKFIYGSLEHKVLVYKIKFDEYTAVVNCNFLNNQLFYVHVCFPDYKQPVKQFIYNHIEREYHCILENYNQDYVLTNTSKEKIIIEADINLNIYYVSNDSNIHNMINAELAKMVEEAEPKAKKGFFSLL